MIFKELLKYVSIETKIFMIGDSYTADIQGALNCGLDAIMVRQENKANYKKHCYDLDGIRKYIV